jgi:hypothetical protein
MAKKMKIDFGGVEQEIRSGGGKAAHVPEGDYLLKIVSHEVRKKEDTGSKYINWRFTIVSPKEYKGKTVYDITSLKPEALWNLRNLIHAATGKNVAGKAVAFDPEAIEGKIVASTLEDDEYTRTKDGEQITTIRSRPVDYRPKDELEADEDDDEEETTETETDDEEEEELEEVDLDEV